MSIESDDWMKKGVGARERDPQTAGAVGCRGKELRGPLPQRKTPPGPLTDDPSLRNQQALERRSRDNKARDTTRGVRPLAGDGHIRRWLLVVP